MASIGAERTGSRRNKPRRRRSAAKQPYCLIIGGGQGGIALGARLKQLGVPAIIVEKNARAGDSWRNRYRSLVLHDPVWYDHLPYIRFRRTGRFSRPRTRSATGSKCTSKVMELDYWGASECVRASYDDSEKGMVRRGEASGRPRHSAAQAARLCDGRLWAAERDRDPGRRELLVASIYHSSRYATGKPYEGKRCVVVGSNTSAHDIAADLCEYGADVTMLQRSSTMRRASRRP